MNWEPRLLAVERALQAAMMFVREESQPLNQRAKMRKKSKERSKNLNYCGCRTNLLLEKC
jgi:hypothetical protein